MADTQKEFLNYSENSGGDTRRGEASKFEKQKYDVTNLSYPADLFGNGPANTYGQNYVLFYINVSTESRLIKLNTVPVVDDIAPRNRGAIVGTNISAATAITTSSVASVVLTGGAATIGAAFTKTISGSLSKKAALFGLGAAVVTGAGAVAAGAYSINKETSEFTRPQKRLKSVIGMHVPNNFASHYGIQYADEDLSSFTAAAKLTQETVNVIKGKENTPQLTDSGKSIAAAVGISQLFGGGALSAGFGLAANPRKEQIFKGVDFRTFSFDYQLYPRSASEARNILDIIQTFKFHAHPEFKDSGGFLYIYPSEFDIVFYQGDSENLTLPRIASCVLLDVTVNYTPNGMFNTFEDGTPTQINLTLNFRELSILTKENIADGY